MLVTLSTGLRHWWDSGSLAWCLGYEDLNDHDELRKDPHSAC